MLNNCGGDGGLRLKGLGGVGGVAFHTSRMRAWILPPFLPLLCFASFGVYYKGMACNISSLLRGGANGGRGRWCGFPSVVSLLENPQTKWLHGCPKHPMAPQQPPWVKVCLRACPHGGPSPTIIWFRPSNFHGLREDAREEVISGFSLQHDLDSVPLTGFDPIQGSQI